jgi:HlyD family secretion protein
LSHGHKAPPKSKLKKKIRTAIFIIIGVIGIGGITYALAKLKPAAPTLERSTAVIETVKRGPFVRDVHGNGTLVPQVTRYVPAPADGRVETILVQVGVEVGAGTVIVELSNPQMEQQAVDAQFQVKAAEADEENLKVKLESDTMTQRSAIASINAEYSQAKLQLDADEVLAKQGLVADLVLKISRVHVQDLANRLKVEQERLNVGSKATKAQLNAQSSRVQQLRALAKLKQDQVDALKVRAGTPGVLQEVAVKEGQQVSPGANMHE